jgi:hypothetical protein
MIPNKKHQIFADEYVLTSDAIKAYQKDIDSILSNLQNGSIKIDKSIPQRGYYIYGIFKNNKIWYIGKGKKNRVLMHFYKSSNNSINNEIAINKNIITYSILYTTNIESEAYEIEKELIIKCNALNIELCNIIYNNGVRESPIYKLIKTFKSFSRYADITPNNVLGITDCINMTLNVIRMLAKKPIIIDGIDITKIEAEKILFKEYETYKYKYLKS